MSHLGVFRIFLEVYYSINKVLSGEQEKESIIRVSLGYKPSDDNR